MRVILFAALCLFVVVFAAAKDVNEGERQDGDFHVASKRLFRKPMPGKRMITKTGYHTGGMITAVTAVNAPDSDANVFILKGGPDRHYVVVMAIGEIGAGIDVQVDIFATKLGKADPEEPEFP